MHSHFLLQFLSKALLECHEEAQSVGEKLALEVFIAGRNRLENEGAKALSQVFEVCRYTVISSVMLSVVVCRQWGR